MTNNEIIAKTCLMNGITEDVHTFQRWKQLGFSVKKGEHAVIKIRIWKAKEVKGVDMDDESVTRMFMKTAAFFTAAHVEPCKDKKEVEV